MVEDEVGWCTLLIRNIGLDIVFETLLYTDIAHTEVAVTCLTRPGFHRTFIEPVNSKRNFRSSISPAINLKVTT